MNKHDRTCNIRCQQNRTVAVIDFGIVKRCLTQAEGAACQALISPELRAQSVHRKVGKYACRTKIMTDEIAPTVLRDDPSEQIGLCRHVERRYAALA